MKAATVAMRAAILCYRHALSPVLPQVCRFQPSCSRYALEAVSRFGAWKGGWLTLKRLARCHPWGGWGYDPVPPEAGREPFRRRPGQNHPLPCQTRQVEE